MRGFILSLILAAIAVTVAQAETIIPGGNVSGIWTLAGSPYIVQGNITVQNGNSLLIGPGVRVQFDSLVTVTVQGRLVAEGALNDTIFFTRNQTANWGGIQFQNSDDTSRFTFCALEYAPAINFPGSYYNPLRMTDCRVSMPLTGGDCYLWLTRCLFTVDAFAFSWGAHIHPTLKNCTVLGNLDFPGFAYNTHIDSCMIAGNLISTYNGNLWIAETTVLGNLNASHNDDMHLYLTNCIIGGDMPDIGNLDMNNCTVYGSMAAYGIPTDVVEFNIQNGSVVHGTISLGQAMTVTITGSTLLGSLHLNAFTRAINLSNNVICDSIWGTLTSFAGTVDLIDNYFIGGSVNLAGYFFNVTHFFAKGNLMVNSLVSGMQIQNIHSYGGYPMTIVNNTIVGCAGHGISILDLYPASNHEINISNNIIVSNAGFGVVVPPQNQTQSTYSDVFDNALGNYSGVTPGMGSISVDPEFVDTTWGDSRLQWGSPCIDTGDSALLDPDNTRSDMGAFYFDQSHPVRVLLTPHGQLIQIPEMGGSFDYGLHLTNIELTSQSVLLWCDVTVPEGRIYGPVLGPINAVIPGNTTLSRLRTQTVPANAPPGLYHYNAYALALGDTSQDSFVFIKEGVNGLDSEIADWPNTGELFAGEESPPLLRGGGGDLTAIQPNPFNAITIISFSLPEATWVEIAIYDVSGRLVSGLVDGWMTAGTHQTDFNGSNLASGVYICRLQAGIHSSSKKLVLLK
jgi:hypothetical protein